jgi:anti-sigma regulatory factor (Ser/Thr protein kinase)/anti-anti-sigma regulatory factor
VARSGRFSAADASISSKWTGTLVNGGLTIEVARTHAVVTLRPHGVLDAYTAPDLRAAIADAVADQGDGVIVDVSDLTVGDDIGLAVLSSIGQENRRWPGVGLTLAGASSEFTEAGERIGIFSAISSCPDVETAVRELTGVPVPPRQRVSIPADRNAPSVARAAVYDFCQAQGVLGSTEAAQLVASELVTNAVVHAGTPIELTLRLVSSVMHVAVRDTGQGQARISGTVDESAESGRGLLLVDALAASWGTFVPPLGKIVWATLKVRTGH